jgi:peptidoglycan hydrolase FlgJ
MAVPATLLPTSSAASAFATLSASKDAGRISKYADLNKARNAAQDFEAVFLNSMFSQMFTAVDGEGPMGGGAATGVWRSFLTDEYAKSFAKKGGIGIADEVYRTLLAQQEAKMPDSASIQGPQK